MKWSARLYISGGLTSEVKGRLIYRLRAEQDVRHVNVAKHVIVDSQSGVLANSAEISFPTLVADPAFPGNTSNCMRGEATGTEPRTPAEWAANTQQWQITERFYPNRRDGYHELGECTVTGTMKARYVLAAVHVADPVSDMVRCDKSPSLTWYNLNQGGASE
ncbi:hypothetical protein [Nonomuraea sp. NPDC003201]